MTKEELRLSLIEWMVKEEDEEVRKRLEQLVIKTLLEIRALKSLIAISNSETLSLEDFSRSNTEWFRQTAIN